MGLVETEALVLKSYGLSEADKIVVFLTREHGLVRGVAKGAKRMKSRFGSGLEPFSIVQLTYFQKEERELVSIGQVELVSSFFDAAADPAVFQRYSYISELLTEFAPPADPNERLYKMATICLEELRRSPEAGEALTLYFELWLLKLGGYLPTWERCVRCGRELGAGDSVLEATFQSACVECRGTKGRRVISSGERDMYLSAQRMSPVKFIAHAAAGLPADVRGLSAIMRSIVAVVLGRESIGDKILIASG